MTMAPRTARRRCPERGMSGGEGMSSSHSATPKRGGWPLRAAPAIRRGPPRPLRPGACQSDDHHEVGGDEGERPGELAAAAPPSASRSTNRGRGDTRCRDRRQPQKAPGGSERDERRERDGEEERTAGSGRSRSAGTVPKRGGIEGDDEHHDVRPARHQTRHGAASGRSRAVGPLTWQPHRSSTSVGAGRIPEQHDKEHPEGGWRTSTPGFGDVRGDHARRPLRAQMT